MIDINGAGIGVSWTEYKEVKKIVGHNFILSMDYIERVQL